MKIEETIKSVKDQSLRYISLGFTKLHPFYGLYSSHSVDINDWQCRPASMYFEFGDDLDIILKITCECNDETGDNLYRYIFESVERNQIDTRNETRIELSEKIESIEFYETSNLDIDYSKFHESKMPNGILIKFESERIMAIKGTMGEDQCEPCHQIKFLHPDEIEIYRIEWMKNWKFVKSIKI